MDRIEVRRDEPEELDEADLEEEDPDIDMDIEDEEE